MNIFGYITITATLLVTVLILIQTRGAGLGAGLGGGAEVNTVRRGSDKTIHYATIILVIIFALSLIMGILV